MSEPSDADPGAAQPPARCRNRRGSAVLLLEWRGRRPGPPMPMNELEVRLRAWLPGSRCRVRSARAGYPAERHARSTTSRFCGWPGRAHAGGARYDPGRTRQVRSVATDRHLRCIPGQVGHRPSRTAACPTSCSSRIPTKSFCARVRSAPAATLPCRSILPAQMTAAQRLARNWSVGARRSWPRSSRSPWYAKCDASVLILGETGTGKEVFARRSTHLAARAADPWWRSIAARSRTSWWRQNCSATCRAPTRMPMPAHGPGQRGRGRHAVPRRGRLPAAAGAGEAAAFPAGARVSAVGSNAVRRADVRVVAASNRDLGGMARQGRSARTCTTACNVLTLALPPLRERRKTSRARAAISRAVRPRRPSGDAGSRAATRSCSPTTGRATCANSGT